MNKPAFLVRHGWVGVYPLVAWHTNIDEIRFAVRATLRAQFAVVNVLPSPDTGFGLCFAVVLAPLANHGLHLAEL